MTRTVSLYEGKYRVTFSDDGHGYFVHEKNKAAPGVTNILKETTAKPALLQWAVNVALQYTTEQLAKGRKDIGEIVKEAKGAHKKISKGAADRGHMVHQWIERWLESDRGTGTVSFPLDQQVINACSGFLKWFKEHDVQIIDRERIVYSDALHYAGTLDIYAKVDGELCIIDNKASSGFYREMPLQLAGYAICLDEELGENHKHGWVNILDKQTGTCTPHYVPLNPLKGAWKNCLSWYRALQVLDQTCDEIKLATSEGRRSWSEQPTFTQALAVSLEQQTLLKTPNM